MLAAACGSSPATGDVAAAASGPANERRTGPADDAVAMRDLQASEKFSAPHCRWLESGAWVQGSPQEEALYTAAAQSQYIEMTQTGQQWYLNRADAPVFRVALTDRGRAASKTCGPTSKAATWGVPVSERTFIAARFVEQMPSNRTAYEVDYRWTPTAVGAQVLHVLTGHMAVQHGTFRTKVYMRKGRDHSVPTPTQWTVIAIEEREAQRIQ